jgi:hypothetical protein
MKRFILGLSTALGLLFALFIGLFFLNPLAAGILFAETTGTGYGQPKNPPALAAGEEVSAGMSDRAEKARKRTGILEQHFPPGSHVQRLLQTLRQQGFKISEERRTASYHWGGMPCLFTLIVDWTEDANHRLASIKGDTYSSCL